MTKITKKLFKEALEHSLGTQVDMAQRLGVARQSMHTYLEKHLDMRLLLDNQRLSNIDRAENEIFEQLDFHSYSKDPASAARIRQGASTFILTRLGKNKGWVEKTEVSLEGNITNLSKEEREAEIKRLLGK